MTRKVLYYLKIPKTQSTILDEISFQTLNLITSEK